MKPEKLPRPVMYFATVKASSSKSDLEKMIRNRANKINNCLVDESVLSRIRYEIEEAIKAYEGSDKRPVPYLSKSRLSGNDYTLRASDKCKIKFTRVEAMYLIERR